MGARTTSRSKPILKQSRQPGRTSRRKGNNAEREVVQWLEARNWPARRTAASGAMDGYEGDVETELPILGDQNIEVKIRGSKNARDTVLRKWLADADLLFLRQSRDMDWYVYARADTLEKILKGVETLHREIGRLIKEVADLRKGEMSGTTSVVQPDDGESPVG